MSEIVLTDQFSISIEERKAGRKERSDENSLKYNINYIFSLKYKLETTIPISQSPGAIYGTRIFSGKKLSFIKNHI